MIKWLKNLFKRTEWEVIHRKIMIYNSYWDNPENGFNEYCSIQFLLSNKGGRKVKLGRKNDWSCNWREHEYYQKYAIPYLNGVNIDIIPAHKFKQDI